MTRFGFTWCSKNVRGKNYGMFVMGHDRLYPIMNWYGSHTLLYEDDLEEWDW